MQHRDWLKRTHLILLIALALTCVATLLWLQPLPTMGWAGTVALLGAGLTYALAEYFSETIYIPGWIGPGITNPAQPREIHITVAEAPLGFALMALGPPAVLPLCLATVVVTVLKRRTWRAVVFNTSMLAISYTVGIALLAWILPTGIAELQTLRGASGVILLLGAIPLWDAWHFSTLITVRSGRPYLVVMREIFGPEVVMAVLPLTLGVVAGILWHFNPALIILAAIPVVLAHRALHAIATWSEEHAKAQAYAHELEIAKATLEDRVRERTHEVEQLLDVRVREAEDAVHDLGHRVSAIETSIDLLQLRLPTATRQSSSIKEAFARVQETIAALRTQLQMVLDAALMQGGQVQLWPECLDPTLLLDDIQRQLTARYQALDCRLCIQPTAEPLEAWCDRVRLERVFFNLLDNAAKYAAHYAATTGHEAHVHVSFSQTQTHIGCHIRDNGPGFDEAALQRLGERGLRLSADPTRVEGNGLGLSFCFRALTLMGGSLQVDSPGTGLGSTFTAWLPHQTPVQPS